jgi:hypothetical protein
MEKIYSVVIRFEDWESATWQTIGHFTTLEDAEYTRDKWRNFFEAHLEMMAAQSVEDEIEEERIEAFYEAYGKYKEIKDYTGIEIQEHVVGIDLFAKDDSNRTKEMVSLVRQWERDYIIDKITNIKG